MPTLGRFVPLQFRIAGGPKGSRMFEGMQNLHGVLHGTYWVTFYDLLDFVSTPPQRDGSNIKSGLKSGGHDTSNLISQPLSTCCLSLSLIFAALNVQRMYNVWNSFWCPEIAHRFCTIQVVSLRKTGTCYMQTCWSCWPLVTLHYQSFSQNL